MYKDNNYQQFASMKNMHAFNKIYNSHKKMVLLSALVKPEFKHKTPVIGGSVQKYKIWVFVLPIFNSLS